ESGQGTTVEVYLPRRQESEADALPSEKSQTGSATILLVDDDESVRDYIAETLKELNYEVVTAANGQSAMEWLEARPGFDLLLTDVLMPGMDGPELAAQAIKVQPNLKVILMSGSPRVKAEGFDQMWGDFVRKPLTKSVLNERISSALKIFH